MNVLTFDIEEWFHILDNDSTKGINEWKRYEQRIYENCDRILELLRKHNQKASFFCLGWIAEHYPDIIRKIDRDGHSIGTHSYYHQLAYTQNKDEFKHDTERSIKTLEDLIGKKIIMYRSPGFSIKKTNLWAFEVLSECGIEIDSSIFPAKRAHGGYDTYLINKPSIIIYNGVELKELPINTFQVFSYPYVFSGGGYFRLTPYFLLNYFFKRSSYVMTYFHPRDFDSKQPVIQELSLIRRYKSYIGLRTSLYKLDALLKRYSFSDISEVSSSIHWETVPRYNLTEPQ